MGGSTQLIGKTTKDKESGALGLAWLQLPSTLTSSLSSDQTGPEHCIGRKGTTHATVGHGIQWDIKVCCKIENAQ